MTTRLMADEREERPQEGEPSGEGAPAGSDPDYHLHSELAEEAKRLATHPRDEAHRLAEEVREGETETTPLLVIGWIAVGLAILVAVVIAFVFLIGRLAD